MSHIGNYLKGKLGGSKAPKTPRRDYDDNRSNSDDSENDESYLDPTTVHPTTPSGPIMPSYPPPRPNHSPATRRVQDPSKRISMPVTFGSQNRPPIPRVRSQRPQSAEGKPPVPSQRLKMPGDDYSDPWDAKKTAAVSPGGDYTDPWDAKPTQPRAADDYCEPWDKKPSEPARKGSKDDYCDPWDAKKDALPQVEMATVTKDKNRQPSSEDSDEESYDEPYDLGKVTALDEQFKRCSIRGMRVTSLDANLPSDHDDKRAWVSSDKNKQSPSKDQRPADDYDSPWESKSLFGLKQSSPSVPKDKLQAPVSDDRPADDYDKPWEWTKKSPLNGHTKLPKQHEPLQSPKADARPAEDYDAPWEWSKSGQQVASMVQSKEEEARGGATAAPKKPPRTYAEEQSVIDPKLPLEQQGWYHGPLKRLEAEELLRSAEDCSFLLRNSESSKNDFSLSVRNNNSFMHLKIVCAGNKYILGQFSKPFDTVPEMIHYYSINKLNIKGAIHKKLLHPVMQTPEYFTLEETEGYSTAM